MKSTLALVAFLVSLHGVAAGPKPKTADPKPPADTAATQPPQDVRDAVLKRLKDPESARFTNVNVLKVDAERSTACGSVNARNSYGGYVGARRFVVKRTDFGQGRVLALLVGIESDDDLTGKENLFHEVMWKPNCH